LIKLIPLFLLLYHFHFFVNLLNFTLWLTIQNLFHSLLWNFMISHQVMAANFLNSKMHFMSVSFQKIYLIIFCFHLLMLSHSYFWYPDSISYLSNFIKLIYLIKTMLDLQFFSNYDFIIIMNVINFIHLFYSLFLNLSLKHFSFTFSFLKLVASPIFVIFLIAFCLNY